MPVLKVFTSGKTNFVFLYCKAANKILTFLVDSGADVTLIKENVLVPHRCKYFSNSNFVISGIGGNSERTKGQVQSKLKIEHVDESNFGDGCVDFSFHVVNSTFPIPTDGILGRDFLQRYRCNVDYGTWILNLFTDNNVKVEIPIHFKMPKKLSSFSVPARTEIVQALSLNLSEDSLVLNQEIMPGVFLANTVVPAVGIKHVKIINTTQKPVNISTIKVKYMPIKDYNLVSTEDLKNVSNFTDEQVKWRQKKITEILNEKLKDSPPEFRASIIQLCCEYHDIFHLEGDKLTVNNFYEQDIDLIDKTPVFRKNFRLPHADKPEIVDTVKDLVNQDIVEPSVSAYNNPIFLVPKKSENGERRMRLVVDFRALNSRIRADTFPLPNIQDILDQLGRSKWFSALDIQSAFYQVPLAKRVRHVTSFSLPGLGSWQFTRLPFGIKIAPNSYSRFMHMALSGLEDSAFCYIDDIVIFGCSLNHHNNNLRRVFQRLRICNLKLNLLKCNFLKPELQYLGHKLSNQGIFPFHKRLEVIDRYPPPTNCDEVLRFVSFCNYFSKWIPNFAKIVLPLRGLMKKKAKFYWGQEQQNAFKTLINILKSPKVLQLPDFSSEFTVATDASDLALGAVLKQGKKGSERPVSYASRGLTPCEVKKSVIEKELLAIHWAIKYFRPILYGRHFILETDHRPLVSLFSQRDPSSKMTRVRLDLEEYDFEIRYKPGKHNVADALSRIKMTPAELKLALAKINTKNLSDSDLDFLDNVELTAPLTSTDLKDLTPKNVDISVVTRSMASKNSQLQGQPTYSKYLPDSDKKTDDAKTTYTNVWEATSPSEISKLPKLSFSFGNSDNARNGFYFVESKIGVDVILQSVDNLGSSLFNLLKNFSHDTYAMSLKDNLFDFISVLNFKARVPKDLKLILFEPPEYVSNVKRQNKLIKETHENCLSGHVGVKRTTMKLKQRYSWKNMDAMVRNYISCCKQCQLGKITQKTKEPLTLTSTPSTSFEVVEIDTKGPAPAMSENGNRYIVTFQCNLTKFIDAVPIPDKSAITVAKAIVEHFLLRYGICKVIKTDLGSEYVNQILDEICTILNIDRKKSTPFHHESLGSIERNHRVLNEFFRTSSANDDWERHLPYYVFSYNTTPSTVHGFTPFELVFGKLPRLSFLRNQTHTPVYNLDNYASEMRQRLQHSQNVARDRLISAKNSQNYKTNKQLQPCNFRLGDFVKVLSDATTKWDRPYRGPYEIVGIDGVNSFVNINGKHVKLHNNRLELFKMKK